MKTPKPEPPSKSDDKGSRRPRPIKPASWLEEVRPDDDVMAVFYGRSPAPAPATETPAALPARPREALVEPPTIAAVAEKPVSRETEIRETGLTRETSDSRGRPATDSRETALEQTGLPESTIPVSRFPDSRETGPSSGRAVDAPAGEAHWPSRRYKARVQTRIPQSLNEELTAYCERRGVTRDAAVDRAIRMLLAEDAVSRESAIRETGLPEFGLPVSRETRPPAHDHDDDHDKKIIMIFERETGRRFRADERGLVAEFRDVDPALVEDAIRYAVKYSREPVGSFAYCAKVIRQRANRRGATETGRPEDERSDGADASAPASTPVPAEDDRRRFEIRTAAARLREAHRDDPGYDHDRLVVDVRAGFVVQGREVTVEQIEEALRGLAL